MVSRLLIDQIRRLQQPLEHDRRFRLRQLPMRGQQAVCSADDTAIRHQRCAFPGPCRYFRSIGERRQRRLRVLRPASPASFAARAMITIAS